jgi:hypothetical protein
VIECVFTLDYEIFGDGTGALYDLVYEPAKRLWEIFCKWDMRFVAFVEVAELEKIDSLATDPAIGQVKEQIRKFYRDGCEIGLHLHPQWCNASYERGRWILDLTEYNLCTLPRPRIAQIVERSLEYLRHLVDCPSFTPLSFRAGNWLFQPTQDAASVLSQHGIKIDSSVFKGGLQHNHKLDYRRALRNGYWWSFQTDATEPDSAGSLVELPVYAEMVPFWNMPTSKRLGFGNNFGAAAQSIRKRLNRVHDFLRFRYPLKLDFCRMTLNELTSMIERVIEEDREEPASYKPLVAIGHTKDLVDPQTVDRFLSFLRAKRISVSTLEATRPRLVSAVQCEVA